MQPSRRSLRRRSGAVTLAVPGLKGIPRRRQQLGEQELELPGLLWTYQMGIILYWIHDRSEGCAKTYKLIDHTVDLVVKLITLSRLPPMRPLVSRTFKLLADLKPL